MCGHIPKPRVELFTLPAKHAGLLPKTPLAEFTCYLCHPVPERGYGHEIDNTRFLAIRKARCYRLNRRVEPCQSVTQGLNYVKLALFSVGVKIFFSEFYEDLVNVQL